MRRAIARGRMLPQSLSTDPRYGRLSLKAQVLYPLMWVNADDQGRLSGDPDEIKYAACPNVKDITAEDIPTLLEELENRNMLKVYPTAKAKATQMLDWWDVQKLQWAYPSAYPPPEGWQDRLRYHATPKEIVTENWLLPSQLASALPSALPGALPNQSASALPSDPPSDRERSKEINEEEDEGGNRRGRGNLPGAPGRKPSPSPAGSTTEISEILDSLNICFKYRWGRVPADRPHEIIPREPGAKELAQLRDLAKELSSGGGCPLDYVKQAFDEAAGQEKKHISYVRAVLLDWLGRERTPKA